MNSAGMPTFRNPNRATLGEENAVFGSLKSWLDRRRAIRRRWQADACRLVRGDERNAYYEAQRLAARARVAGRVGEFAHWAKVAAEVARISHRAEMDLARVQAIVDEDLRCGDERSQDSS
ncbi:hypothetical protein ACFSKM_02350 [Ancylobacter dichloromethanicus]|nr:hypothetical protein [Ancylobacter dichloromethanicus]